METTASFKELVAKAEQAENNDDFEQAISFYQQAKKIEPGDEYPYNRLMILYRKLGRYKDELNVIKEGIKYFESRYENLSKNRFSKNRKIKELSNALMKKFGLIDKKGNNLYYPEPVGRWRKRKHTAENKLRK